MLNGKFYKLPQDIAARKELQATDKIVYAVIVDFIGGNETGWPGKRCLMKKTGLADKTVCDSIKRLELSGLLIVERRGNGKSNHYKTGSESEPVQKLNRFKTHTVGGSESEPEAVQPLNPNQTDLLNKRGREHSPEEKAKINFQAAKAESNLPTDFLTWWESEILGRWDKYKVTSAILSDWHNLFTDYGRDILIQAVKKHRQETDHWNPSMAAVKKLAGKIRAEQKRQQQPQPQQPPNEPAAAFWNDTPDKVAELYRTGSAFQRSMIAKHRPEIVNAEIQAERSLSGVSTA